MKRFQRITALFFIVFLSFSRLYAQDSLRVSLSLQNKSFDELVRVLEIAAPLHFYYDKKQTDTLKISVDRRQFIDKGSVGKSTRKFQSWFCY